MTLLDDVHNLSALRALPDRGQKTRLWTFSRTTGWERTKAVMDAAGLSGIAACAKGLRHGYAVQAVMTEVPETRLQEWLGHASLETTAVYLDVAGRENRAIAERMWRERMRHVAAHSH